jgi:FKBP-type peptidyl-prolyl cis-trans isomerase FkpA
MQKRWIILISSLVVVFAATVGGIVWWKIRASDVDDATTTHVTSDRSIALSNDSNGSKSIPLDGKNDNSSSAKSENDLKVTDSSQNTQSAALGQSTTGASNSSSSSTSAANDFSQYEKYQNEKAALFGDVKVGDGEEISETKKTLSVYYKGWLTNGKLFDQRLSGDPFIVTIGEHKVIAGWEQALGGTDKDGKHMKVGGVRRIIVPPSVGYGAEAKGEIPASSLLIFDVELISLK